MKTEKFSLKNQSTQTNLDQEFRQSIEEHFNTASGTVNDKLNIFPRFVSRQSLSQFIAKHEIFKEILPVHGSIVECGVFTGGGIFTWFQLSSIYEPVNHGRKIIGFDSFEGFPSLAENDKSSVEADKEHKYKGAYSFNGKQELLNCAEIHDLNRAIGHIPKLELVEGDAVQTIKAYVEENPHLVISLLYLDFDLYEPTKAALKYLYPRIPKGGVIAFDELNQKQWPGETTAVLEEIGISNLKIKRFPTTPSISYAVLE